MGLCKEIVSGLHRQRGQGTPQSMLHKRHKNTIGPTFSSANGISFHPKKSLCLVQILLYCRSMPTGHAELLLKDYFRHMPTAHNGFLLMDYFRHMPTGHNQLILMDCFWHMPTGLKLLYFRYMPTRHSDYLSTSGTCQLDTMSFGLVRMWLTVMIS